jgi:hypothetical protein
VTCITLPLHDVAAAADDDVAVADDGRYAFC